MAWNILKWHRTLWIGTKDRVKETHPADQMGVKGDRRTLQNLRGQRHQNWGYDIFKAFQSHAGFNVWTLSSSAPTFFSVVYLGQISCFLPNPAPCGRSRNRIGSNSWSLSRKKLIEVPTTSRYKHSWSTHKLKPFLKGWQGWLHLAVSQLKHKIAEFLKMESLRIHYSNSVNSITNRLHVDASIHFGRNCQDLSDLPKICNLTWTVSLPKTFWALTVSGASQIENFEPLKTAAMMKT